MCLFLFGVRSTPVLPKWHVKDLGHSAKKCRWQVIPKHAYTLDPTNSEWADYTAVQAQCGNLSGNELTRNSSGNIRPQSSQLAEPLWIDPGLLSGISVRELISTLKKKCRQRMNYRTFSKNPRRRGKSHHHHHQVTAIFFVRLSSTLQSLGQMK